VDEIAVERFVGARRITHGGRVPEQFQVSGAHQTVAAVVAWAAEHQRFTVVAGRETLVDGRGAAQAGQFH